MGLERFPEVNEPHDLRVTLEAEALAFLRQAHTDEGGALATALALTVLRGAAELPGAWTRLALDVRDAVPMWAAKAVSLAALVLEHALAVNKQDHGNEAGGQR